MKLVLIVLVLGCTFLVSTTAEESCSWKPDGTQVCDDEEGHNIWTDEVHDDDDDAEKELKDPKLIKSSKMSISADDNVLNYFKHKGVDMNKLELEIILNYIDNGQDGVVDISDLESIQSYSPVQFVKNAVDCFNRIDLNDDGKLTKKELQVIHQNVDSLETLLEKYSKNEILILEYLEILSKLHINIKGVLSAFLKLNFLTEPEIKKVMEGSVKAFTNLDEDKSGSLSMVEYLKSLDRPGPDNKQTMDLDQKLAIFKVLDVDKNEEISYQEFQLIMPQKPKDIKENLREVFRASDTNGDGFWSSEEFEVHLKTMAGKMGGTVPQEAEIEEAFNQLDKDEDGKVSEEEMQGIQAEIEKLQEQKAIQGFIEMDTDGDGQLSREEMEVMASTMEERSGGKKVDVDLLTKMLDTNEDGLIQMDEVKVLVKRMQPPIPTPT